MWERRRVTNPWDFTACYRDNFTSIIILKGTYRFGEFDVKWRIMLIQSA
jgi:hypothetical protein